jgi:hypothetical protein
MRRFATGLACIPVLAALAVAAPAFATPTADQPVAQGVRLRADIAGFDGDPTALPRAISAAEQSSGGTVVQAQYASHAGGSGYQATVANGNEVTFMSLAQPAAGVAVMADDNVPLSALHGGDRRDVRIAERAPISLAEAVTRAEDAHNDAPAVAAGIAISASNPTSDVHAYNVLLLEGGRVHRVAVDSATGDLIANPSALSDSP